MKNHALYLLRFVNRKDILVLDGYPEYVVLENHRKNKYFWAYCTADNKKVKIKYEDVDAILKADEDTGEIIEYYSRRGRDPEFFNKTEVVI